RVVRLLPNFWFMARVAGRNASRTEGNRERTVADHQTIRTTRRGKPNRTALERAAHRRRGREIWTHKQPDRTRNGEYRFFRCRCGPATVQSDSLSNPDPREAPVFSRRLRRL